MALFPDRLHPTVDCPPLESDPESSFHSGSGRSWLDLYYLDNVLCGWNVHIEKSIPQFAIGLLIAGLILIIGFTIPPKYFFKDLFVRLITIFLSVINSFADVVSYIRLFAVGLATVAIADAFNSMAASLGWSTVITGFFAAIILLFGSYSEYASGGDVNSGSRGSP